MATTDLHVWVAVADYGLNGSGVLGVFKHKPTDDEIASLAVTPFHGLPYGPSSVTGYGGVEVERVAVKVTAE